MRRSWVRDLRNEDYQREVEAQREVEREKQAKLDEDERRRAEQEWWEINDATRDMLDEEQQR